MAIVWDITFFRMDDKTFFFLGLLVFLDPDSIPELLFETGNTALDNQKVPLFPFSRTREVPQSHRLHQKGPANRKQRRRLVRLPRPLQAICHSDLSLNNITVQERFSNYFR